MRYIIFLIIIPILLNGCDKALLKPSVNQESVVENKKSAPELKGVIAYLGYTSGFWQVFTTDFHRTRQITESSYDKSRLSWFPDGEHLLVNGINGRIFKVSLKDGKENEIKTSLAGMTDAVISPDGKQIVFSLSTARSNDANNLWLMNSDGTNLRKLTKMKWLQHEPTWGTRGEWIYFLSGRGGQTHDIWRISTKTGNKEQLTAASLYHFDVSVAANGTLAYSGNRSGNYEIWTQTINGKPRQLTHNDTLDARPTWSADGQWIAYESATAGIVNIWIMSEDGSSLAQLTQAKVGARFPVWKPIH